MDHEFLTVSFIEKLSVTILTISILLYTAVRIFELWIGMIAFLYLIAWAFAA